MRSKRYKYCGKHMISLNEAEWGPQELQRCEVSMGKPGGRLRGDHQGSWDLPRLARGPLGTHQSTQDRSGDLLGSPGSLWGNL